MSDEYFAGWSWVDGEDGDLPDSVEAFWDVVRDLNYDAPVRDGDLCAVYRHDEDAKDGFEHVLVGRYDEHRDAVETVLRAGYSHGDVGVIRAETQVFSYELEQIAEDSHRVAAFGSGPGWRDGHGKEPIDIENVPEDVMEQLKDHGTYWSRNGGDVLAVDRWDDRLMRFHGQARGEAGASESTDR